MEVRARGQHLTVTVNGKETVRTVMDSDVLINLMGGKSLPEEAQIGLLNWYGTVRYRKIEAKKLPPLMP
jgi:hypothetical protein